MSNIPAGGRGVSTTQLIIFILLILASGVTAYVFYTEIDRLDAELGKAREEHKKAGEALAGALKTRKDLYDAIGYGSLQQIRTAFDTSLIKAEPQTLEKLLQGKFAKRDELIKSIGVDPRQVDESGQSQFLQQTITKARQAAKVPDNLKNTKVGDLIAQLIRLDEALAAREKVISENEAALLAADQKISDKNAEIKRKFTEMDEKAAQAWNERVAEQNKLRFEPPKWDTEAEVLERDLALEQSIKGKLDRKMKIQKDLATPIDGKILTYDWQRGRGTVDLGARDNVKPGYEFDVYGTRPGPDRPDKRIYHARIQLLDVGRETSLFTKIVSEYDAKKQPVLVGDLVSSQLYDETRPKTFAIKGWFPGGGDYSKESIAGIIIKDGGIVEKDLTLDTDYLIVGVIDEKVLTEPSEEAKRAVAEGARAYEEARHTYVTVLTLEKFFRYMNRTGLATSP